ncbi:hypothetical protein [Sulfuracidifex tepidarius]|nr:hypothetical protein [Sulfuracidifex tepidarius]
MPGGSSPSPTMASTEENTMENTMNEINSSPAEASKKDRPTLN